MLVLDTRAAYVDVGRKVDTFVAEGNSMRVIFPTGMKLKGLRLCSSILISSDM